MSDQEKIDKVDVRSVDNAIIAGLVAGQSNEEDVKAFPQSESTRTFRDNYSEMERELRDNCPKSLGVSDKNYQFALSFHPNIGLRLTDQSGVTATHWVDVPDTILAKHRPLLILLRSQYLKVVPRSSAELLKAEAEADVAVAVTEGAIEDTVSEITPEPEVEVVEKPKCDKGQPTPQVFMPGVPLREAEAKAKPAIKSSKKTRKTK